MSTFKILVTTNKIYTSKFKKTNRENSEAFSFNVILPQNATARTDKFKFYIDHAWYLESTRV
jgi:hypothetical protein